MTSFSISVFQRKYEVEFQSRCNSIYKFDTSLNSFNLHRVKFSIQLSPHRKQPLNRWQLQIHVFKGFQFRCNIIYKFDTSLNSFILHRVIFIIVFASPQSTVELVAITDTCMSIFLCLFESLHPINNLSVTQGRVFLG